MEVSPLPVEEKPFAERITKVPASAYTQDYSGFIRVCTMGNGDQAVPVGGATSLPFHLFEGEMPNPPLIAMGGAGHWLRRMARDCGQVLP